MRQRDGTKMRGEAVVRGLTLAATAMSASWVAPAFAKDDEDLSPKLMLGAGPGTTQRFEGSDEYRAVPFVFGQVRWGNRYFIGTDGGGVRADIIGWRFIEAGPEISYSFGRNVGGDDVDPVIAKLPKVGDTIEVGAFLAMNFPAPFTPKLQDALTLEGSWVQAVNGGHEGSQQRVALRYRGRVLPKLAIQAGPFATYGSLDFMNSFYDVTPEAAAASGLEAFDAEQGWKDVGGRANAVIMLGGKWQAIISGSYRHYINDAAESPIVAERGSEGVWFGGGAISRRF